VRATLTFAQRRTLEAGAAAVLAAAPGPRAPCVRTVLEREATGGTDDRALLRREGDYWSVSYRTGAVVRMRDGKGLRYIAELLAHPGREFAALALGAAVDGVAAPPPTSARTITDERLDGSGVGDAGDVLDPQAREAYRARLADLDDQVEEGERFNDPERAARARAEIEILTRELSASLGLGGRPRRVPGQAERARQSVTKAIRTTIRRLGEHDPELAAHLTRTIHTGARCRYDPDPCAGVQWTL